VFAPSPGFLIVSGVLLGFYQIIEPIAGAIEMELVPAEQMGRWIGLNRIVKAFFGAGMALVGGFIWDRIGPQYVFLFYISIDLVFKFPLLVGMPETLNEKAKPTSKDYC